MRIHFEIASDDSQETVSLGFVNTDEECIFEYMENTLKIDPNKFFYMSSNKETFLSKGLLTNRGVRNQKVFKAIKALFPNFKWTAYNKQMRDCAVPFSVNITENKVVENIN